MVRPGHVSPLLHHVLHKKHIDQTKSVRRKHDDLRCMEMRQKVGGRKDRAEEERRVFRKDVSDWVLNRSRLCRIASRDSRIVLLQREYAPTGRWAKSLLRKQSVDLARLASAASMRPAAIHHNSSTLERKDCRDCFCVAAPRRPVPVDLP
jgi:hypothetical protein